VRALVQISNGKRRYPQRRDLLACVELVASRSRSAMRRLTLRARFNEACRWREVIDQQANQIPPLAAILFDHREQMRLLE
jgi:hypothetical protein